MVPMIAMSILHLRKGLETHYRKMVRLAAITVVVVYLGLILSETLNGFTVGAPAEIIPAVASAPPAEIPREWQWQRETISFDDMYREDQPTPELDWIRNPGLLAR